MSHLQHKATSPASVACFVLSISDTRTEETDTSGGAIAALLTAHGHTLAGRAIVPDEPTRILEVLAHRLASPDVAAIITTGGTGISRRDGTYEVVAGLLERTLEGFGELFRMLSYEEIGAAAMMSRACAGIARGKVLIALPGSENAVRLAMTKLVLPELGHLVREATR